MRDRCPALLPLPLLVLLHFGAAAAAAPLPLLLLLLSLLLAAATAAVAAATAASLPLPLLLLLPLLPPLLLLLLLLLLRGRRCCCCCCFAAAAAAALPRATQVQSLRSHSRAHPALSFITSEASDRCQQEKRKTINGDDLLWAMGTLGFREYSVPLKTYLAKYRSACKSSTGTGPPA